MDVFLLIVVFVSLVSSPSYGSFPLICLLCIVVEISGGFTGDVQAEEVDVCFAVFRWRHMEVWFIFMQSEYSWLFPFNF